VTGALDELQPTVEHPDPVAEEGERVGRVRHLGAARQRHLDELEIAAARGRHRAPDVAGGRVGPGRLVGPADQPAGGGCSARAISSERLRPSAPESRPSSAAVGAAVPASTLAIIARDTRARVGERADRQAPGVAGRLHDPGEAGPDVVHGCHYSETNATLVT